MMREEMVLAMYDELVDRFESATATKDNMGKAEVSKEVSEHVDDFLEAGFDATQIAKMLSPRKRLKYFKKLVDHGAVINATKLMRYFKEEELDKKWQQFLEIGADAKGLAARLPKRTVFDNWERFIENGITPDELTLLIFDTPESFTELSFEEIFERKGVSAETIVMIGKMYSSQDYDGMPESVNYLKVFELMKAYGIDRKEYIAWVDSLKEDRPLMYYDIVSDIMSKLWKDEWKALGFNAKDYALDWVIFWGEEVEFIDDLPEEIQGDAIEAYISQRLAGDLLASSELPSTFMEEYLRRGGSKKAFYEKIAGEKEVDRESLKEYLNTYFDDADEDDEDDDDAYVTEILELLERLEKGEEAESIINGIIN